MGNEIVPEVKTSHVNLSTDTVIANLPVEGLRSIVRAVMTTDPAFITAFETQAKRYLQRTSLSNVWRFFEGPSTEEIQVSDSFKLIQRRVRGMLGCGLSFESLHPLICIIDESSDLTIEADTISGEKLYQALISIDGDTIQAITGIQKATSTPLGTRELDSRESTQLKDLFQTLLKCQKKYASKHQDFVYERSLHAVADILKAPLESATLSSKRLSAHSQDTDTAGKHIETFTLGSKQLPRLFSGLWQLSSPAWGSASQFKIVEQFERYVASGFTAYDMADHYGDAEIIFGRFRAKNPLAERLFASTKYCVFAPITVTPEVVRANVTQRVTRLHADKVDLLQFHWQNYKDPQYIEALRLLQDDERVSLLGLCNFDTYHMEQVIQSGIHVVTNQVQFSLIDSRPIFKMGSVCEKHEIKLLTYGTLCGGFLSDKWLGQQEPELFLESITPSQRKYYEMIRSWGGWTLFQELLKVLASIAAKHSVTISNVATRWVLDFPYVGAVIVGARMGVSEHTQENLATYGWKLDGDDQKAIEDIQLKSRRDEIFQAIGDCGAEYR